MLDMKAPIAKQVLIPAIHIFIYVFISCHTKWQMPNRWGKGWPFSWPPLSWHGLSCTGHWQLWLCVKRKLRGKLILHLSTSLVCFCSPIVFFEHRLGMATCARLIQNLHTNIVMFMNLNGSWCVSYYSEDGCFVDFACYPYFCALPLCCHFPSQTTFSY